MAARVTEADKAGKVTRIWRIWHGGAWFDSDKRVAHGRIMRLGTGYGDSDLW